MLTLAKPFELDDGDEPPLLLLPVLPLLPLLLLLLPPQAASPSTAATASGPRAHLGLSTCMYGLSSSVGMLTTSLVAARVERVLQAVAHQVEGQDGHNQR